MKKQLLFAVLFLATKSILAQIEWQKNYGQPNLTESLFGIFPAFESGHFWAAGVTSSVGNDDFFILKMDSTGHVVWADTLGSPLHNEKILAFDRNLATGDMVITGNRKAFGSTNSEQLLIKLDASGQKTFEIMDYSNWPDDWGFHSAQALSDGGVLAYVGAIGLNAMTLRRFDAMGGPVFSQQTFDGNGPRPPQTLAALPDGRFFMVQPFGDFNSNDLRTEIRFRNAANVEIWKKNVQSPSGPGKAVAGNIIADPSDSSVIAWHYEVVNNGERFLTKIGAEGSVRWQVKTEAIFSGFERLVLSADGLIALVFKQHLELRNAKTGALISVKDFSNGDPNWPKKLRAAAFLPTAKVALVGDFLTTGSSDGYFGLFQVSDHALLEENLIGSAGLPDSDGPPVLAEADGHLFIANGANFGPSKNQNIVVRKVKRATGEQVFEQNYGSIKFENMQAMVTLSDGKLLLAAAAFDNVNALLDEILLLKIDPTGGTVIWQNVQPNPKNGSNIRLAAMPDGGAVIIFQGTLPASIGPSNLSNQIQVMRVSAAGDLIFRKWIEPTWSTEIAPSFRQIESMILLQDGSLLAVGGETKRSGLVLRINAGTGAAQAVSLLDPSTPNDFRKAVSAAQTANGELLVLSQNYNSADSLIFYRLTQNGDILQRKSLKKKHFKCRIAPFSSCERRPFFDAFVSRLDFVNR